MNEFWNFYENMNEVVYVSDIDTYELTYMNQHARKVYGIEPQESLQGRKCYELLQGCSAPCAMCTNRFLKKGEFYEWSYYNPIAHKTFAVKDSLVEHDGHRYRLELCIDISLQETQRQTIREFVAHESMINNGLRQALSAATPELSLKVLLEYLGRALKCDRVYIFETNPDQTLNNTYEWCANGVAPHKDNLQQVPYKAVEHWYRSFHQNQNVIIKNLKEEQQNNPTAYEYLAPQKIHTLVVSPLISHQKIIGFYGVDNPPQEFMNHISTMFQVLGHFITSIIRRRNLVNRLETLSYYDQLTGAKNRHGMNEFVANVEHHKSIGLVYCDVMGLKKINDNNGHLEGDALLIRSCSCLKKHFPKESVFRIGGDEFLMMQSGISEQDLQEQVEHLRRDMPNHDIMLAIGTAWSPRCNGQITELMKLADARMYDDKRKHYEQAAYNRRQTAARSNKEDIVC